MKKSVYILILLLVVSNIFTAPALSKEEKGRLLTASSGKGEIILFWYVPAENWPDNGWQLSDAKGNVLVDQILPLSQGSRTALEKNQIASIEEILKSIANAQSLDKENKELFNGLLAMTVLSSFETAKALGLAWKLSKVSSGPVTYQITALDKNKKPKGVRLLSKPIDAAKATPLPPAPKGLNIIPDEKGAKLFWQPVPDSQIHPVVAYEIQRQTKDKALSDVFKTMKGIEWNQDNPAFVDTGVPVEQTITYQVYSIDSFGRKSLPASISLFIPDMMTLIAPETLSFKAMQNQIDLSWNVSEQARPAGFLIERSSGSKGLYQVLTPKGLNSKTLKYTDKDVIKGIYYYYRVRSLGTDGALGQACEPVMAKVDNSQNPPPPGKVIAKSNPILVILSWEKSDYPVKGYIVERRSKGSDQWARRNDTLLKPRTYKDHLKPGTYGVFYYRITATGFDGHKSRPSKEVMVELKDLSAPLRPVITSIDGSDGKVTLSFEPNKLDKKTKTFTILRDLPDRKQGNIIKQGLSAKNRQFVDDDVISGQGYWYAVVALDENGKESDWSEKHLVKVIAPDVPKPDKPSIIFIKTPFAHVNISFKLPPEKLSVSLQRKDSMDAPWVTLSRGLTGTDKAMDTNPVKSENSWYRIVYHSINGPRGEPSEAVESKP
ncbi:MAG: hypothetical protein ABIJ59_19445 [Pseudomonadota bacterium]